MRSEQIHFHISTVPNLSAFMYRLFHEDLSSVIRANTVGYFHICHLVTNMHNVKTRRLNNTVV